MVSAKLTPAALTAMRTSPGPGCGSGRSSTWRTSGPPTRVCTTALMPGPYLQRDGAADEEAIQLENPVDRRLVDGCVRGDRHDGRFALGLRSDGRRDDVDALLAEDRAHLADHSRLIGVAEDRQVIGEGQEEVLAPDPD